LLIQGKFGQRPGANRSKMSGPTAPNVVHMAEDQPQLRYKLKEKLHQGNILIYRSKTKSSKDYIQDHPKFFRLNTGIGGLYNTIRKEN
jgi:hypothetical protein